MNKIIFYFCAAFFFTCNAHALDLKYETILRDLPVHPEGDKNVFANSFDYRNGVIYAVHVESGDGSGKKMLNLHTVVRKGIRQQNGSWSWSIAQLEKRTLLDPWHTQGSIALDKNGFVHVAYNMHNMPWQYVISKKPYDISSFNFQGKVLSDKELEVVKIENKTPFPDIGSTNIPGNQISYPMFFSDNNGELYLTYRFALKPARKWEERAFSGAIARYDVVTKKWLSIGGPLAISASDVAPVGNPSLLLQKPFAFEDGYSVYLITLGFDNNNGMHVFWNWRSNGAGEEMQAPSYAFSPDGKQFYSLSGTRLNLPLSWADTKSITAVSDYRNFYAFKSVAITADNLPIVISQPVFGGREIWSLSRKKNSLAIEKTPYAASVVIVDNLGRQWVFASGVKVFMRETGSDNWRYQGQIGSNLCSPKVKYYAKEQRFIVHAKSCSSQAVSIFTFKS